jgi:uncharacterized protein DUF6328
MSDQMTAHTSQLEPGTPAADGRDETRLERYDRNLTELMGELRVALPGVQVLFAFLHRLVFHQGEKGRVVRIANRLMIAGMFVLAVAMTSAVALVTNYLFGTPTTIITTVAAALAFVSIWLVLPFREAH